MRLLRDNGEATNRPRTQHTLVNLGQNCKRIMQPVTSTAVPRTITVCSCFAVGFVLNIVIMMKMTRPCSESPCSGVHQVDPTRLLHHRHHQLAPQHTQLHQHRHVHLALVLTRLTLPAFWMERGNTRFWIPTSVTSAEPDDLVVSMFETLEIKKTSGCVF